MMFLEAWKKPINTEGLWRGRGSLFSILRGLTEKKAGVGSGVLTKNLTTFRRKTVFLKVLLVLCSQMQRPGMNGFY